VHRVCFVVGGGVRLEVSVVGFFSDSFYVALLKFIVVVNKELHKL